MRRGLLTLLLVGCCAASVWADTGAGPVVSLDVSDTPLTTVAADLSTKAKVPVLLDTGVTGVFSGSFNQVPLDKVLDLVAQACKVRWQQVFVPAASTDKDALAQAQAQVALLSQVKASGTLMIYDPATKQQITFTQQASDPSQTGQDASKLGLKPVYLISAIPSAAGAKPAASGTPAQQYSDLARQQADALLQMSPQDRVKAMQQALMDQMNMDPSAQLDMAKARIQAFQDLRQNNPAAWQQFRQMQHQTWQTLRSQGVVTGHGGRGPGN